MDKFQKQNPTQFPHKLFTVKKEFDNCFMLQLAKYTTGSHLLSPWASICLYIHCMFLNK